ncbi:MULTISPECIES: TetR/AcrR family transcriptional regulator [Pseudomonas]|uniref:TetR/AcrR family transcriptional regulator n=1 Tax=Pseudomonas izuensis TaxID=2684212 RepID=A0ABM7RPG2_9PSED|nr:MULTISPECIES: TetR/AcrR family transcriptional regulator [Pseudomonas]RKS24968.1 TetR family transcriptional regulator [Pseudomonas sp. WPR_5_2]BCX67580.1 TetR/AcrR family transcriptional regulator [Pseudomonas izuensis]
MPISTPPLEAAVPEPLTRGHKKRERTRRGLMDAALRLVARKEVGEIALLEVAAEAAVSNGTIYNYFRTRDEVIEAVGIAMAAEFSDAISVLNADVQCGAQRVSIGVRMFVCRAAADHPWANALLRIIHFDQAMRSRLADHVLGDLRAGLQEGSFTYEDEGIALDMVVSCTTGAMRAVVEGRAVAEHDVRVAEMILQALGVTPAKARKIAAKPLPG